MNSANGAAKQLDGAAATVKDFWASRPRRPDDGRKIAGVAAGVGMRYGIDPVVIRVALVALTFFGGVGPAVYLLGWLLLPGRDDEVSPFEALLGHGRSETTRVGTLVLCAACFPAFGIAFGGTWLDGGGVIGLALVVTALYLMHRSRGHLNRPAGPGARTATPGAAATGAPVDTTSDDWDALGADPLGWDLADRTAAANNAYAPPPTSPPERPPRPRRRRSKVTWVTLALALIAAGITAGVLAQGANPAWNLATVPGVALAVLGGGMIVGSFLGGGRGLILAAVPVAAAATVLAVTPLQDYSGGVGELHPAPTTTEAVQSEYTRTAGSIDLDLTRLQPGDEPVSTTVRVGAGEARVLVPESADVDFSCDARTGNIDCFGRTADGIAPDSVTGTDRGNGDGPDIRLSAEAGMGSVEVQRVR